GRKYEGSRKQHDARRDTAGKERDAVANLVVDTTCGKVKGERINGVSVWKGIPYAKPPIGELRFRPPEEPVPWPGIREATRFGPIAMQPDSPNSAGQAKSEDCLYLNVW